LLSQINIFLYTSHFNPLEIRTTFLCLFWHVVCWFILHNMIEMFQNDMTILKCVIPPPQWSIRLYISRMDFPFKNLIIILLSPQDFQISCIPFLYSIISLFETNYYFIFVGQQLLPIPFRYIKLLINTILRAFSHRRYRFSTLYT
jgi:hypothetical protein